MKRELRTSRSPRAEVIIGNQRLNRAAFHAHLRDWWLRNGRTFPWRSDSDPFHLLLAEMMLRRTRASQVIGVYTSFIDRYPDAKMLADAEPKEVATALYSLGLAWRVPAFQALARALVERHGGRVPDSYEALVALPGVGDYVASAICCFSFKQPIIIADTNTVRVIGRLAGVATHAESRRSRAIREMMRSVLDEQAPDSFNYALLDLAALVCTPRSPSCRACPVLEHCKTGLARTCEEAD